MSGRLYVLGAGSLGTLWAAHSSACTTLLLREGTAALRARSGRLLLRVHRSWAEPHERQVEVEPSTNGPQTLISTLVVATKAYSAASGLEGVQHRLAPDATVVLLCNGPLSLAALPLPPTASLLVATTTHGAWLHAPRAAEEGRVREVQHAGSGSTIILS